MTVNLKHRHTGMHMREENETVAVDWANNTVHVGGHVLNLRCVLLVMKMFAEGELLGPDQSAPLATRLERVVVDLWRRSLRGEGGVPGSTLKLCKGETFCEPMKWVDQEPPL